MISDPQIGEQRYPELVEPANRIDARDLLAVVRASATNRLGVPLLRIYSWLLVVGAIVVLGSIAAMYLVQ